MIAILYQMSSGECRWVGRENIHVYRWSPVGRDPRWKVWTARSTGRVWDDAGWTDAVSAVRQIESLLAQEIAV